MNAYFDAPLAVNEPILDYLPGSKETEELKDELDRRMSIVEDIPMHINGQEVRTDKKIDIFPPHQLDHLIGQHSMGTKEHVEAAIDAAMNAKEKWAALPWQERAAVFLKAAELLSGPYRAEMNAATMIGQSKNVYQSEIDAICELADFYRFNVQFMTEIYADQPESSAGVWNRMEYRPLEGFVFALTPFNFTAIAGNLPGAPVMLGNTCVWKPAETQIYSANLIMKILKEAGLPDGVINLVYVDGPSAGEVIFSHPDFGGLHFTGSTNTFNFLWKTIGQNIGIYKSYPRIVGETGGKDFVLAHSSADPIQVAVALARGAFEYQGQKCSAASRAYLPTSLWPAIKEKLTHDVNTFKMGSTLDFSNFINAVIDQKSFDKIKDYIDFARESADAEIIQGGECSTETGYFIEPTIILTTDPHFKTMQEEIFGPVLTIYVYEDEKFEDTLELVDSTSPYALTGSIFAKDRYIIKMATDKLKNAAGNFYINDKPTGAVVGQQPFGGARGSGTNDKAGSVLNLYRWISARTIKETFVSPTNYRYPFLGESGIE